MRNDHFYVYGHITAFHGEGGKRLGRNNHPTPPVLLILPQSKGRANKTRQTKIIIIVRCKKIMIMPLLLLLERESG